MTKKSMFFVIALFLFTSIANAEVGISVSVGQPGFYGQIDIGDYYPQPQVVYAQPVIIERVPVRPAPIYLHVPPGHAKHWSRYCGQYGACARPVYFVRDTWYNDVYVPKYQARHHPEPQKGGPGRHDDKHGQKGRGDDHGHGPDKK
ncbi:MAG: hypothetical protein ACAH12_02550 [Methylophilaceae bacterium]